MFPRNRWLVLAIVSSALFLIVIDMTVLYTALPRLTHDLAATATQKLWIINAYPLVVAGLLPGLGALGDRFGHKRMFLTGLAVFGTASLAAAFAPSAPMLIAARVLLAVGAAMMMPATLSLIRLTFTDEGERAFAIGIWAAVASGGAALGPVIGGLLLEWFWWGSVFLINVPVVLLALVAGAALLVNRPGSRSQPFDLRGSVQVMIGLVGLIHAVKEISKRDPSWMAAALGFAIGLVAMIAFVRRQLASTAPLIDFSLFRDARFSSGVATALVASAALIGVELVFSQRLQLVLGHSPLQAGLLILPIPLASFIAGPLAGLALPRLGETRILWTSLTLTGCALAAYLVSHDGPVWLWLSALAVMGFGVGAAMTAASSVIMLSAPEDRAGMAASIEEVSYELGGALGIALLGSLMSALYSRAMIVPVGLPPVVADSLDEALMVAETMSPARASEMARLARAAFDQAFVGVIGVAILLLLVVAFGIWRKAAPAR
ncbi:MFS transporter, DHA2 family, multidrug resistance protein [Paracoccus alcaliphilus]|uniref:MFS transporter, DHA2 family, multidrug resistance protein n=1 Tax=Paracoccus alcaliphilus TaxID=34002 RepID=A0A1H8G128_9RHOB|nr:MFS transporter [Paracoccus alcaliphilus]WCR20304.1 MFS transporter [Paracoccus alcaliphilus]SEN37686.1 MFS transporter, DHA2 family, multidrug resistance protein [Paracoccus alcaliphilus]